MGHPFSVSAELVDCGFDYLTATSNTQKSNSFFDALGSQLLAMEQGFGSDVVSWGMSGFSGLTSGQVQYATNGQMRMLRVSGALAQQHWKRIAKRATNVSRADLQTTYRLKVPKVHLAEACERQAKRFEATHNHGRQIELRRNTAKGKTVYVGSRKSDRLIRIYDKGLQSQLDPAGTVWRAEIQFNRKLAQLATTQALDQQIDPACVARSVVSELTRVGIVWWSSSVGSSLKASSAQIRRSSDMRLSWLTSQVKPTVQKLIDAGREKELLDALGLTHLSLDHGGKSDGHL